MRTELVRTFLAIDRPETSGMLAAIAAMGSDMIERRRIADALAERSDLLPAWLAVMGGAEATWTAEATHILRDGENVYIGVRFPTGDELSAVIYVDHNMGTVVKDAFVTAQAAALVVPRMHAKPRPPTSPSPRSHPPTPAHELPRRSRAARSPIRRSRPTRGQAPGRSSNG